jgi:lipoprotein-releasing system ATP-binding protein
MGKIILEAQGLNKSYLNGNKKLNVLKDFSILLEEKQIITIMGDSGSGNLFIAGKVVKALDKKELSNLRNQDIGFVFQFHYLLPEFTAFENVLIPTWIKGDNNTNEYANELFSSLGLSKRKEHFPSQLSGGERSRVALIRAIINKPKILFADEPTGNLDYKNAIKLVDLLMKINENYNQSIILTTHNPEISEIGHKKFNLVNGTLNK